MDSRSTARTLAALTLFLCAPLAAQADDLMLRVRQTQSGGSAQYTIEHAQTGSFAHQVPLPDAQDGDLIAIGRDAAGRELFRSSVRNPGLRNAEVFDPATGAIVTARKIVQPEAVVEMRMPNAPNLATIDLVEHHPATRSDRLQAAPQPLRRLARQELDALIGQSGREGVRAKAAIVPTGSAMLWQTGASASRMDLVIIGDGYASADQAKWRTDAQAVVNGLLADPLFDRYKNSMNIRRVDIVSPQSGVSENFGAIARQTALGTVVGCFGLDRLVCADNTLVANAVAAVTPVDGRDVVVLVANSGTYGGSGAPAYAALTMHPQSIEIALHEIGHTAFQLADEYDVGTCNTPSEPTEADVTLQSNGAWAKWSPLIKTGTVTPTQPGWYANGTVGLFDGGKYCPHGVYRPTENSRMRTLGQPWHGVNELRADFVFNYYHPGISVNGNLAAGATAYLPSSAYHATVGGTFRATLSAPSGSQFDMDLMWWNGSAWQSIAQAPDTGTSKILSFGAGAGYYLLKVTARSGSGAYNVVYNFPN
ncbi:MAG: M64 family metallopeptidase [Pseudomonadota bacterium]